MYCLPQPDVLKVAPSSIGGQPRWEWRVFERAPGAFISAFRAQGDEEASRETYIVSENSPHNVKIRHGQLDVKLRLEVATEGIELWNVVLKTPFPISARDVETVCAAWSLSLPTLLSAPVTRKDFMHHVVDSQAALHVVRVLKHRSKLTIAGCRAEVARVSTPFGALDTLAIEDTDVARVLEARWTLGSAAPTPMSYPAALKELAGVAPLISLYPRNDP